MHALPASAGRRLAPPPPDFVPYLPPALAEINVPAYVLDRDGRGERAFDDRLSDMLVLGRAAMRELAAAEDKYR